MKTFDRYFHVWTGVIIVLMAVSLFFLNNTYTTPLLGLYLILLALHHRLQIADLFKRSTPGQKAALALTFVAVVALSFILIRFGVQFLESQGIGTVFVYIWIALVIGIAVALLMAMAKRFGLVR